MTHRAIWRACWGSAVVAVLGLAALFVSLGEVLATLAALAVMCGTVLFLLTQVELEESAASQPSWRRTGGAALRLASAMTAVVILARWDAATALVVVALAAVTSPPAVRWAVGRMSGGTGAAGATTSGDPVVPAVECVSASHAGVSRLDCALRTLSDDELCHAWRHSFLTLERARTTAQRALVVRLRQGYLDELERRNPQALAAWLGSGARAAGGPEKFLRQWGARPDSA